MLHSVFCFFLRQKCLTALRLSLFGFSFRLSLIAMLLSDLLSDSTKNTSFHMSSQPDLFSCSQNKRGLVLSRHSRFSPGGDPYRLFPIHRGCLCADQVLTCPNASFTDLAEIVSRIEPVKPALVDGKKTHTCSSPPPPPPEVIFFFVACANKP